MINSALPKKILSLFVGLTLVFAFVPVTAYADEHDGVEQPIEENAEEPQASEEVSGEEAETPIADADQAGDSVDGEGGSSDAEQNGATGNEPPESASNAAVATETTAATEVFGISDEEGDHANSWRYTDGELTVVEPQALTRSVTPAWEWNGSGYVSSNGEIIEGALFKGIDVSEHQGKIDWAKVKADGIDFAIIRCGYGQDQTNQDDDCWEYNVSECERLGIPYGVYLYSYADSVQKASGEADHALRLLNGHNPQLPVYYDLEESSLESASNRALLANMATTFCDKIKSAGYTPGVYANLNWWNNYLTDPVFDQWDRWVAQYNYECRYEGEYSFWQCTSSGSVDGISGNVDINFGFTDKFFGGLVADAKGLRYRLKSGSYVTNELKTVSGKTYYFGSDGYAVKGWKDVGGKRYYFGSDFGAARYETWIGGKLYYFDGSDCSMHTGWLTWWGTDRRSYFGSDGAAYTGLREVGGDLYLFASSGKCETQPYEQFVGGKMYYFDPKDGYRAHTGWLQWWNSLERSYFGDDGAALSGWQTLSGKRYYFDPADSNHTAVYEHWIGGRMYYFDKYGVMHTGWLTWWGTDRRSYFGSDGAAYTGLREVGGDLYLFASSGKCETQPYEQFVGGKMYYFDPKDGYRAHTGWLQWWNSLERSYFGDDGAALSGWQTLSGKRYYFDPADSNHTAVYEHWIGGRMYYFDGSDCSMHTGWLTWWGTDRRSYFGSDGAAYTGLREVGGDLYLFASSGKCETQPYEQFVGGKMYYFDPKDGYRAHTGWLQWWNSLERSYFGDDGAALSGWQTLSGKRYYFDPADSNHTAVYEHWIGGRMYYFDKYGVMHTGWLQWWNSFKRSLFGSDGAAYSGWQTLSGDRYYFNPSDKCATAIYENWIGGKMYYFDKYGVMHTGWLQYWKSNQKSYFDANGVAYQYEHWIDGKMYYFDPKNNCKTHMGWLRWYSDGSYSYFSYNTGAMLTGDQRLNGIRYSFGSNGKTNSYDSVKDSIGQRAQGFSSGTKYLVLVNRDQHKVAVFQRISGAWELVQYYSCVVGASGSPTITGTYRTTGLKKTNLSTDSRARWCTQINGGYFFHSILASESELGKNLSHGCIRLPVNGAKWIYNNIGSGTTINIYN